MEIRKRPQVVVITGASAGLGRALARWYGNQGAHLGLIARGIDGLTAAVQEVEAGGGSALALPLDVSDAEQLENAAERVEDAFGPIDVWINNAMVSVFSPFQQMTPEEFRRVNDVTYMGYVYGTMAALKRMARRDHGTIVQVGSALAYRAIPLQSAYCGAKHAIQGFTESVRTELLHDGSNVRITMVQLPAVNTPQFGWVKSRLPREPQPVPPIFQPEVIARGIAWAAEHAPREMNIGLSTSIFLLGNKLFPGIGDWYLSKTGYESQQTDEPVDPNRRNNLWEPVAGDHGARGAFGTRARNSSIQLWYRTNRRTFGLISSLALAAGAYRFWCKSR